MTGQVPLKKFESDPPSRKAFPRYLIIGSGRLAKHLKFWLTDSAVDCETWNRSEPISVLESKLRSVDVILLAISDSAIQKFYELNLAGFRGLVVHFSGSFHDARIISAHPLMSFSNDLYPIESYSQIHWTLCGFTNLENIFPFMTNSYSVIDPSEKALYHAACVIGGNFPVLLWNEMDKIFAGLSIPLAARSPYLRRVLENYMNSPQSALTGPLVRNDQSTMDQNMAALENLPTQKIYESFRNAFVPRRKEPTL